jgi:AraC-like DNA-binding protein
MPAFSPLSPDWALPYVRWRRPQRLEAGSTRAVRQCHDHLFLYIADGAGSITINGAVQPALAGRLFYVLPSWFYTYEASTESALHLLTVHFDWVEREDSPRVQPYSTPTGLPKQTAFSFPNWEPLTTPWLDLSGDDDLRRAFEELNSLPMERNRNSATEIQAAGWLLVLLGHLMSRSSEAPLTIDSTRSPATLRRLEAARICLESLDNSLTPAEIAAQNGWSLDFLRHLCREVYSQSPLQLQTRARLRHARTLLAHNKSISEAAERCGFADASYFARLYRREFGVTPSEDKRRLSKQRS